MITDFGAMHNTVPALQAGTDMETGTTTIYDGALLDDVTNGTVPETLVDQACLRILRTMFRLGVFNTAYTPSAIPVAAHDAVARQTEEQAITLLKNNNNTLPLSPATKSITVVGADANILASPSGAPWVSPTEDHLGPERDLGPRRLGERELGAGQRSGQRRVDAGEQRHDYGALLGAHADQRDRQRAQRLLLAQHVVPGCPSGTRVDKQVNYDVGFLSTFGSLGGADLAGSDPAGRTLRRAAVGRLRRQDHRARRPATTPLI